MEKCHPQKTETTFKKLLDPSARKKLLQFLKTHKPWNSTLLEFVELMGVDVIRKLVPEHFIANEKVRALSEYMQVEVVPPMNADTTKLVKLTKDSRHIVDDILEEVVLRREAEYAGKMYVRDPNFKISLASISDEDDELDAVKEFRKEILEDDEEVLRFPHAPPPTPTPLEETEEFEVDDDDARHSHNSIQSRNSGKRTSANSATSSAKEDEYEWTGNEFQ